MPAGSSRPLGFARTFSASSNLGFVLQFSQCAPGADAGLGQARSLARTDTGKEEYGPNNRRTQGSRSADRVRAAGKGSLVGGFEPGGLFPGRFRLRRPARRSEVPSQVPQRAREQRAEATRNDRGPSAPDRDRLLDRRQRRRPLARARQQVERGVFDIETVKKANEQLIATIEESLRIADQGKARRAEAERQPVGLEAKLKTPAATAAPVNRGEGSARGA
jgi:hypothetical protein